MAATKDTVWIEPGRSRVVSVPAVKGKLLHIEFDELQDRDVDFRVMQEDESGEVIGLYGPSRRARRVSTAVRATKAGTVHVSWDNSGSWLRHKQIVYELTWLDGDEAEPQRPRAGRTSAPYPVRDEGGTPSSPSELVVAAGTSQEVSVPVTAGATLTLDFDVQGGRDVDFGVMLVPADGSGAFRIYGPMRRATRLHTEVDVPADGAAYIGFDATQCWFRQRVTRRGAAPRQSGDQRWSRTPVSLNCIV